MLAYYTTLVKREDLIKKLSEDGNDLATLVNDLACELKMFASACNIRDVETCLDALKKANEISKVVSAMVVNVENNYKSYVSSLIPQQEPEEEKKQEQKKEVLNEAQPDQLKTLLETVKSLKEMKDSLGQ